MTFASLLEDLRGYLERGDVQDTNVFDQLPRIVAMAEKRIAKEIKPQGFERYLTSPMGAGQSIYAKPNRWRETRSIRFGVNAAAGDSGFNTRVEIFPRSYEYCRDYWPNPTHSEVDSPPRFYGDYGYYHIIIVPTPAVAYPYEWAIWQLLQPLDDANQTNWLTQYAPEVLLYACLLESTPYLGEDGRIQTWQSFFDRSVQGLLTQDARKAQDANVKPEEGVQ